MDEVGKEIESVPVLSYANLRGAQPIDSRFVCEQLEDGVRLTEPASASDSVVQVVLGISVLTLGLAFLIAGVHRNLIESHFDALSIFDACAICCIGLVLFLKGRSERGRQFVIEVRDGRLRISHRSIVRWRRSWRITSVSRIKVDFGSPSISSGRLHSDVLVLTRWGLAVPVLMSRPKDECLWVAKILREAMNLPAE